MQCFSYCCLLIDYCDLFISSTSYYKLSLLLYRGYLCYFLWHQQVRNYLNSFASILCPHIFKAFLTHHSQFAGEFSGLSEDYKFLNFLSVSVNRNIFPWDLHNFQDLCIFSFIYRYFPCEMYFNRFPSIFLSLCFLSYKITVLLTVITL